MNPWDLSASDLLVWGIVLHLIADWPLQNDWMARNKMLRRERFGKRWEPSYGARPAGRWWDRHPAAYAHAGIHGFFLSLIFGWVFLPLALAHLLIDTRVPLAWWSKTFKQTKPVGMVINNPPNPQVAVMDLGMTVRLWVDQVFHIVCIAIAALLVTL